jgi:hypothetical protein
MSFVNIGRFAFEWDLVGERLFQMPHIHGNDIFGMIHQNGEIIDRY